MVITSSDNQVESESSEKDSYLVYWVQTKVFRTNKLFKVALILVILLLSITLASIVWQFLTSFAGLLLLFTSAWLIALLLTPIVKVFMSMGLPKILAIVSSYLIIIAVLVMFGILVVPNLITQTQDLVSSLGSITGELQTTINGWLKSLGLGSISFTDVLNTIQAYSNDILKGALNTLTGLAGFLLQMLLVLIISFSLLTGRSFGKAADLRKKAKARSKGWWSKLPRSWKQLIQRLWQSLEINFGVFLGGQLTVSIIYGVAAGVLMSLMGFNYAVTTACLCALIMIIPFFGGPLSLLPPLLLGLGSKTDVPIFILLLLLFVLQTALLNVVLPKLVGRSSGIGPVMTLFVLLAGSQIGGIWGVLLSVPLAGVVKNMMDYVFNKILETETTTNNTTVAVIDGNNIRDSIMNSSLKNVNEATKNNIVEGINELKIDNAKGLK
jgi:predicted PurR-regulated permease PerM